MTATEKAIIEESYQTAMEFGLGILTLCKENIEDAGFEFTENHEQYIFKNYIEN